MDELKWIMPLFSNRVAVSANINIVLAGNRGSHVANLSPDNGRRRGQLQAMLLERNLGRHFRYCMAGLLASISWAVLADSEWCKEWKAKNPVWRGVHVMVQNEKNARELMANLDGLKSSGVNVVIAEVDYNFAFKSHPELHGDTAISGGTAGELAKESHRLGIRLIPQMSCLGHQSWAKNTYALLTKYPELDETPGQYPGNTNIYCRSWWPRFARRIRRCNWCCTT